MITLAQIDTLERAAKFFLQKLAYAQRAVEHLEAKKKAPGLGYDLDLAQRDAERQERTLVAVGDELSDELTKLLKAAAASIPQGDGA